MTKQPQRPIDVKDMPWSHMGKDVLDEAAERVWNVLRDGTAIEAALGCGDPYHVLHSSAQTSVQRAVIDLFGHAVPAMLRQRAKEMRRNGANADEYTALLDLADELEAEHG